MARSSSTKAIWVRADGGRSICEESYPYAGMIRIRFEGFTRYWVSQADGRPLGKL
jgi:hypothetical protein